MLTERRTVIALLMASPFYGGPERQLVGLARHLPRRFRPVFLSFSEQSRCRELLDEARRHGFEAVELRHNYPHLARAAREVAEHLRRLKADVLMSSGYKSDIVGWWAARKAGIPAVCHADGWTAATWKVRLNEWLDRRVLRWMDRTVCVSAAQTDVVYRSRVPPERVTVIPNAIDLWQEPIRATDRTDLAALFPQTPTWIIGVASRLSPEKGIDQLVQAAAIAVRELPGLGFAVFGNGPLRQSLEQQIVSLGLDGRFVLAGYRRDFRRFLPHCDLAVLPSFTEGMPTFVLEAMEAGLPVVATAVGGTPELVEDGKTGCLVPPGDPASLAERIVELICDEPRRLALGLAAKRRIQEHFTFSTQSEAYERLFDQIASRPA